MEEQEFVASGDQHHIYSRLINASDGRKRGSTDNNSKTYYSIPNEKGLTLREEREPSPVTSISTAELQFSEGGGERIAKS